MERILIITSVHNWNDERIYEKEAKSLSKKYYVTIIGNADFTYKEECGIKVYGTTRLNRFKRRKNLPKIENKIKEIKPSIIHFHDPELIPFMIKIKKRYKIKIIYDIHEDYPSQLLIKQWIPKVFRRIVSNIFNIYEKTSVKHFDAIINVNEIINNKFNHDNKFIIKNYPSIEITDSKLKNKINSIKKNENLNVVYLGGLTKARGIEQLVEAMSLCKNRKKMKLTICGKFDTSDLESKILKDKGDNIEYLGLIDKEQVMKVYDEAHIGICCLLPYGQYERSLPMKLFEYMATGTGVICSDFTYWEQVISKKGAVRVNPLDSKAISDALDYLYDNRQVLEEQITTNYNDYINKYKWKTQEDVLFKLYELLI